MSQTATAAREPLLRIAKREGTTMPQKIAVRAIAILLALVVDALFIFFVTGLNPLSVYGVMWSGTFANMTRFSWMLRDRPRCSASASRWPRPSRCASGTAAARARS